MKDEICQAFCSELQIKEVPAGLAVGTAFEGMTGDRIGFYVVGPAANNLWSLQDDGTTVPYLEAAGADLGVETRKQAFQTLLAEYGATYAEDTCELRIEGIRRDEVPQAAMKFVSLLLRVQDLSLLTRERAESTWIEEAIRDITKATGDKASIVRDQAVSPALSEWPADLVIKAESRDPVALFFGQSDAKVYEALLLHYHANYSVHERCTVVILLEHDASVTKKARQRADNNVIVPRYRGDEQTAIGRVVEAAIGQRPTVH